MRRNRLLVFVLALLVILLAVLITSTALHSLLGNFYWRLLEIRLNATFATGALIGLIIGYFLGAFRDRFNK